MQEKTLAQMKGAYDATKPNKNPFWIHAIKLYQQNQTLFLRMQGQHDWIVTHALFVVWLASIERCLINVSTVQDSDWQKTVVQPLRAIRKGMKGKLDEGFRSKVKKLEQEAEQMEMARLYGLHEKVSELAKSETMPERIAIGLKTLGLQSDDIQSFLQELQLGD